MYPKEDCNFGHRNVQNFLFKNLYELYSVQHPSLFFFRHATKLSAKRKHILFHVVGDNSDLIRTFAVNREYTCTRSEKYSSKLDISRSFFVHLWPIIGNTSLIEMYARTIRKHLCRQTNQSYSTPPRTSAVASPFMRVTAPSGLTNYRWQSFLPPRGKTESLI